MSYWAFGRGSLTLHVDEQSVSDLRTRIRAHYDKLCQEAQKSVGENSLRESISRKYQTEKQMLEDFEPSDWIQRELRGANFSDMYIEKIPDSQCLHIETSFDGKYYEELIMPLLELLSPQTVEGELSFQGEDDALWRLLFTGTGWVEQSGQIVYTDLSTGNQASSAPVDAAVESLETAEGKRHPAPEACSS